MIATKLGTPLILDSYTSSMCKDSWGRSSFDRTLIDLNPDVDLKESMDVHVPRLDGKGTTLSTIRIEYEWKPTRCATCKMFGHCNEQCPKKIISDTLKNAPRHDLRGFQVGQKTKAVFHLQAQKDVEKA